MTERGTFVPCCARLTRLHLHKAAFPLPRITSAYLVLSRLATESYVSTTSFCLLLSSIYISRALLTGPLPSQTLCKSVNLALSTSLSSFTTSPPPSPTLSESSLNSSYSSPCRGPAVRAFTIYSTHTMPQQRPSQLPPCPGPPPSRPLPPLPKRG